MDEQNLQEIRSLLRNLVSVDPSKDEGGYILRIKHGFLNKNADRGNWKIKGEFLDQEDARNKIIDKMINAIFNFDDKIRIKSFLYPGVFNKDESPNLFYPDIPSYKNKSFQLFKYMLSTISFYTTNKEGRIIYQPIALLVSDEFRYFLRSIGTCKSKETIADIELLEYHIKDPVLSDLFPLLLMLIDLSEKIREKTLDNDVHVIEVLASSPFIIFKSSSQQDTDKFVLYTSSIWSIVSQFLKFSDKTEFDNFINFFVSINRGIGKNKLFRPIIDKFIYHLLIHKIFDFSYIRTLLSYFDINKNIFGSKEVSKLLDEENLYKRMFRKFTNLKEKLGEYSANAVLKRIFYDLRNETNPDKFFNKLTKFLGDYDIGLSLDDIKYSNTKDFYNKSTIILLALINVLNKKSGGDAS